MKNSTVSSILRTYPNVRRALWKRHTLPFLFWLCWVALLSAVALLWIYPQFADTDSMVIAPAVWLVLCILPLFLFRIPQRLLDRSFVGTILSAEPDTVYQIDSFPTSVKAAHKWTYFITLTVRTDEGKVRLCNAKVKNPSEPSPYEVGQRIVHLRGSEHPIILEKSDESRVICPVCGAKSPQDKLQCVYCNRSLIRSDRI